MSGGVVRIRCARCGKQDRPMRQNQLIGGWYCVPCDLIITKPDPKLEAKYNRRVAERARKEAAR